MCHSQYNLCDPLVNITMKTPLDLSLLFLRTFLTTRWLLSLTVPLGSETRVTPIFLDLINAWWFNILSFASLWQHLGNPWLGHLVEPLLWAMEPCHFPSPLGRLHGSFSGLETSALCFLHHLLCVLPKPYLRHPLNLIWPEIFWQFVNLVVFHSIPFIFRTCPHYPFVCRAYDFPWLPPPLWSMDTVVRIGNLETPKGPTARFLTTIFCLFNLKIILE